MSTEKRVIHIHPGYLNLSESLEQIPKMFWSSGVQILDDRNILKIMELNGKPVIVKYYKRIVKANRYIYATIRKSKAQRAFENSARLLEKDINTPQPLAYINIFQKKMLYQSYYICDFSDCESLRKYLDQPIEDCKDGLEAFARFTCKLHEAGIIHKDYNLRNILYKRINGEFDFSLIDNNRIKFSNVKGLKALWNFRRLKLSIEKLSIIGAEYARSSGRDELKTVFWIILSQIIYQKRSELKLAVKKAGNIDNADKSEALHAAAEDVVSRYNST